MVEPLVYTVEDIKVLRRCGRDKAYAIAKKLPHYIEGNQILVFKKDFDEDFENIRKEILEKQENKSKNNVFKIRKFS